MTSCYYYLCNKIPTLVKQNIVISLNHLGGKQIENLNDNKLTHYLTHEYDEDLINRFPWVDVVIPTWAFASYLVGDFLSTVIVQNT